MTDLTDKTILITGASRGIGAAAARHFSAQGARVVLTARDSGAITELADEIAGGGGSAAAIACDVADYATVEAAVAHAVDRFGALHGLINNAGLIDPIARLADSDPAEWGYVVDVNLKGVYHGMRAAIPEMLKAGGGTIVNISSGAATSPLEGWSHYCSTKAGVLMLTRMGHKEYGDQGIRVMGLSPGTVATGMQTSIKASGINPVSELDWEAHIPPEWVAQGLAAMFGPAGDAFLGQDFSLKTAEGRAIAGLPSV